ncbi:MAG: pirin family protein [Polyangiaceae bacterium]|nr:pirin family protein [Polyangiaceae bacterium]
MTVTMRDETILSVRPLGFPWETTDPFLFCVHHDDAYPEGNEQLGPNVSLEGRNLGQDFVVKDGFRMYHGEIVPGFPQHPHRGFETVTIARRGLIDHSDSLGAAARFGRGDVQWMTAGRGVVHSEMFPLVDQERPNPVELFQIWLNLPSEDKLVEPHFTMLWSEAIPTRTFTSASGAKTEVAIVAGELDGARPPAPPPHSWASRTGSDVAIWTIKMEANAKWTMPAAKGSATKRTLYFFVGSTLAIGSRTFDEHAGIEVVANRDVELTAGPDGAEILLLQGRPIGQPVAQYGPFVMNTRAQIQQAMTDYQRTRFGGWPWPSDAPVHARDAGRFARHADGKVEEKG